MAASSSRLLSVLFLGLATVPAFSFVVPSHSSSSFPSSTVRLGGRFSRISFVPIASSSSTRTRWTPAVVYEDDRRFRPPASTALRAGRKKGSLAEIASSGGGTAGGRRPGGKKNKERKATKTKQETKEAGDAGGAGGGVSPALARWAASDAVSSTSDGSEAESTTSAEGVDDDVASFVPFGESDDDGDDAGASLKKKGRKDGRRRERQKERNEASSALRKEVSIVLNRLIERLSPPSSDKKKKENVLDVSAIVDDVRTLANIGEGNEMRTLALGKSTNDYRLLWVGGDDALCHVGTGLHKVPLARMQEVFLTLGQKSIEIQEVIRILGPFPNVKNVLRGDVAVVKPSSSSSSSSYVKLRAQYESMIDGTGKEILPPDGSEIRIVELDVLFANEDAVIFAVPPKEEDEDDATNPFRDGGSNLLLFVKENDLDMKLQELRVN